jgi:hypothetical protein
MSSARQSGNLPANQGRAPNGVCHNFWQSGQCRFAGNCKYPHRRPGQPAPLVRPVTGTPATANQRRPLQPTAPPSDRVSTENGVRGAVDAGQAGTYLNVFCSPKGALKTISQIKMLLKVLNGVSSEASNWVRFGYSR